MNQRSIDILLWFVCGGVIFAGMYWLGLGTPHSIPEHLPPASQYRALANLICFAAALDAVLIGSVYLFTQPSAKLPGDFHERRHRHAGRMRFMSLIAFVFSFAGLLIWYLPGNRDTRALVEEAPYFAGAFVLMTVLSGLGIVLAQHQQRVFDRRLT